MGKPSLKTQVAKYKKLCKELVDIQAATGSYKHLAGMHNKDLREVDVVAYAEMYQGSLTQLEIRCREELDYHPNPTEFHYEEVEENRKREEAAAREAEFNQSDASEDNQHDARDLQISDEEAPRPLEIDRGEEKH